MTDCLGRGTHKTGVSFKEPVSFCLNPYHPSLSPLINASLYQADTTVGVVEEPDIVLVQLAFGHGAIKGGRFPFRYSLGH